MHRVRGTSGAVLALGPPGFPQISAPGFHPSDTLEGRWWSICVGGGASTARVTGPGAAFTVVPQARRLRAKARWLKDHPPSRTPTAMTPDSHHQHKTLTELEWGCSTAGKPFSWFYVLRVTGTGAAFTAVPQGESTVAERPPTLENTHRDPQIPFLPRNTKDTIAPETATGSGPDRRRRCGRSACGPSSRSPRRWRSASPSAARAPPPGPPARCPSPGTRRRRG